MGWMVQTTVGSNIRYRLFDTYQEAHRYHDKQVDTIYFDNATRQLEITSTQAYGGRVVGTRLVEWVENEDIELKEIGRVKIIEWEDA